MTIPETHEQAAVRMFPTWSAEQRARWVKARIAADRIGPKWSALVPLTRPVPQFDQQFAVRSLREIA